MTTEAFAGARGAPFDPWASLTRSPGPSAGAGKILGRRIEVDAMRSDGSIFPAELAICKSTFPARLSSPPASAI